MAAIKPLLIISDAVSAPTGLARITRDLSTRIHQNLKDVYRVATFGYGAPGSCRFGFTQYAANDVDNFVLGQLPEVWHDFAGQEQGVVLCIWDPSRLGWLSTPHTSDFLKDLKYQALRVWLERAPFKKWIYAPVDAEGPNNRLTFSIMKSLFGFDRILAYSAWGAGVIERTMSTGEARSRNLTSLPHGIDGGVFSPSPDRSLARSVFNSITGATSIITKYKEIEADEVLVGIVATNQARKDWALGIETAAILSKEMKVRLWIHTDALARNWDILGLLIDHGMLGEQTVLSSGYIADEQMAEAYSACDVTLGIGPEGFGYPIFESIFCGTPCVHGNYGGAPELLTPELLVTPIAFHKEGPYSSKRPVYAPEDFAAAVRGVIGKRASHNAQLDWKHLWPRWEAWFRQAAGDLEEA
jgi:glycosyltransferase involved in cell wall biosynthesis